MKRNILVVCMLAIISIFCFTACNSSPSITGNFKETEYIISIDDSIDFSQELNVSGVEIENIVFTSSNENVISKQEDGAFKGIKSGMAYIFATYNNKTIASVIVLVKYPYSTPTNFNLTDDGLYSWDKSFVDVGGESQEATSYEMGYCLIDENTDPNHIDFTYETLETNSFQFQDKGSYYVIVKALSDDKYLEDSSYSEVAIVNYGVMGILENVEIINNDSYGSQEATIEWDEKTNAVYDVYIQGIKIFSDIQENNFAFDYSIYDEMEEVKVRVDSKDTTGTLMTTTTQIIVKKLVRPTLNYNYSDNDGFISWNNIDNSQSFLFRYSTVDNSSIQIEEFANENNSFLILEGEEAGFYNLELVAKGGLYENVYYVNSDVSQLLTIYKLDIPKVDITFEGQNAKLVFEDNDYVQNYKISYADQTIIFNTENGLEKIINLSGFEAGEYSFTITALPTYQDGEVVEYTNGEVTTSNILNSNNYEFEFYVLGQVGEIQHNLIDGQSLISFPVVENANYYVLLINDEVISSDEYILNENDSSILITLNDLSKYSPYDDTYRIKIMAGRRNLDNSEIGTIQERTKDLTIMPLVTKAPDEEQENGNFVWNNLDINATYSYKIYRTESDYVVDESNPESLVATREVPTDVTHIDEILPWGYYVIRIVSHSTDYNNYLDSNFYNDNNYFEIGFFVTEQIATPDVRFSKEGGVNKLIIDTVDFGGTYVVRVDGREDGRVTISDESDLSLEYIFDETFDDARLYSISVIATSGRIYDGTLFLDSDAHSLSITKLSLPTYEYEENYSSLDAKTEQLLTVNMPNHANHAVIKLDNTVVNTNNENYINMIDYEKYDDEYNISIQYIADDGENDEYYLDSDIREVTFKRVNSPTSIRFSDGELSFVSDQENIDNFYIFLTLRNSTNSNFYVGFFTEDNSLTFDLQEKIDELNVSDSDFASAYRLMDYLQVEIYAQGDYYDSENNIYYIASFKGTTLGGNNLLDVYKLDSPSLNFDSDLLQLSWNNVAEGSTYDIYIDDVIIKENLTTTQIAYSDLGGLDFTTERTIYVKSKNPPYLDSKNSDSITLKKLATVKTINISQSGTDWIVSIPIQNDTSNISGIKVNGQDVTYSNNIATFKLADFDENTFNIQVIYKNLNNGKYFINSDITSFFIQDLDELDFNVRVEGDNIVWDSIATNFIGNDINPLVIQVKVTNNGKTHTFEVEGNSLSIQEIEDKIQEQITNQTEIVVSAVIKSSYSLTLTDGNASGYYGQKSGQTQNIIKLSQVGNISHTIYYNSGVTNVLDQKLNAYAQLKWNDDWSTLDNINFNITIKNQIEDVEDINFTVKAGDVNENYSLSLSDGEYTLTLYKDMLAQGINDIEIVVERVGSITSLMTTYQIERLNLAQNVEISDSGILTVNNDKNTSYIVQVSIQDKLVERSYEVNSATLEVNLMTDEFLAGSIGAYTVKVVAYDNNNILMPSISAVVKNGTKLEGIDNIYIEDEGNIVLTLILDDFSDLVWTAKLVSINSTTQSGDDLIREFNVTLKEGSSNEFYVPMIDIINLFKDYVYNASNVTFAFTVRKAGSIDADWVEHSFRYEIEDSTNAQLQRGTDLTKTYIIYKVPTSNDNTLGFRAEITTSDGTRISMFYNKETTLGYWVTNSDGSHVYFTLDREQREDGTDYTYQECYGININDIVADQAYGEFKVKITRIGRSDDVYYQYNEFMFDVYKLNETDPPTVNNNYLTWGWAQHDTNENYSKVTPTAYYIQFYCTAKDTTTQIVVYKSNIDLRNITNDFNLDPGFDYIITITAVHANSIYLSSNSSESLTIRRYITPAKVGVTEGRLTFDIDYFKSSIFMSTIIDYFNPSITTDYVLHDRLQEIMSFTSPYSFSLSTFSTNVSIKLKFTPIESTGTSSKEYTMTVSALDLFPMFNITTSNGSISYLEALQNYKRDYLNEGNTEAIINTKNMIDRLAYSNFGIGDDEDLFDDYGEIIPSGKYYVSLIQTDSGTNIESSPSEATEIYITASPEISLENTNSQYVVNVIPTKTYTFDLDDFGNPVTDDEGNIIETEVTVQRYKMLFRYYNVAQIEKYFALMISYNGSYWQISYEDNILNDMNSYGEVIITNTDGSFVVNMSALRKVVNDITANTIQINTNINVDIFAYNENNAYVPNGKAASFVVNYLDMQTESINFVDGSLWVEATLENNFEVLARFKPASSNEYPDTITFRDGIAQIDFTDNGSYEYVILSINGSISANRMNVESDKYKIENLYKLNEPELSTRDNNLYFRFTSADANLNNPGISFKLGNDISLAEGYLEDDMDYYYSTPISSEYNNVSYIVGGYASEMSASIFYALSKGNNGTFSISANKPSDADFLLLFNDGIDINDNVQEGEELNDISIISSEQSSISAKMLSPVGNVRVENGNVVWNESESAGEEFVQVNVNSGEEAVVGKIIYQVDIDYYQKDINDETFNYYLTDTYYTTSTSLLASYISMNYNYYKIKVTTIVGIESDQNDTRAKQTIEGEYFTTYPSILFSHEVERYQVLRSETTYLGNNSNVLVENDFTVRTDSPYLDTNSVGVKNGAIEFVVNSRSTDYEAVARTITIFAEYTSGGETQTVQLSGQTEITDPTTAGYEDKLLVSFTPDEGQLNDVGVITINVYMYDTNKINSSPLRIQNVNKLTNLTQNYYSIGLNEAGNTYIDFSSYFNSISINNDNTCYKLVLTVREYTKQPDGSEIESILGEYQYTYETEKIFIFTPLSSQAGMTSGMFDFENENKRYTISVQIVDAQSETQYNPKLLLNSDTSVFELQETQNNGLSVAWDDDQKSFYWNWSQENVNNYEFYADLQSSLSYEQSLTNNYYYMPMSSTNINSGEFSIRARQIPTEEGIIYIFSDPVYYEGDTVSFSLFSGGNGTESSPYLINSKEQFINISKRNVEGETYYFRLNADIEINDSDLIEIDEETGEITYLIETFYGVLDGNERNLTINSTNIYDFTNLSNSPISLAKFTTKTYTKYSSLFKYIDSSATIKNLQIIYRLDYNRLDNENVIFAPLALYNYGRIESVDLTSFSINRLNGNGDDINSILVGGLVAVNEGTITTSNNTASFNLTLSQINMQFGYFGLSLINYGTISQSFNSGNKVFRFTLNDQTIIASGISAINSGRISVVGNDGNFTVESISSVSNFTSAFAGISMSSNGTLEHLYNNGTFTRSSNYGALDSAGISYSLSGGTINNLIDTTGSLFMTSSSTPSSRGTHYAKNGTGLGTSSGISARALQEATLTCGSTGFTMNLFSQDGGENWRATIVRAS